MLELAMLASVFTNMGQGRGCLISSNGKGGKKGSLMPRQVAIPQIGMVATVRNRRGVISCVRPFDGPEGALNLVDIEYNDGNSPLEESLIWEREPFARLLPPSALEPVTTY